MKEVNFPDKQCAHVNRKDMRCPAMSYKKYRNVYLCRGHYKLAVKK